MAWRSIVGKKGRSTLTILSIFIGIAAVMTIVSVMEGMKLQVMKQFNAMGTNRIEIQIEVYSSDESGNSAGVDYFPKLYSYRQGLACFSDKMPKAYNGNNTKKQGKNYKFLPCFFVALYRPVCPIGHIVYL